MTTTNQDNARDSRISRRSFLRESALLAGSATSFAVPGRRASAQEVERTKSDSAPPATVARGEHGAAATVHPRATAAAIESLRRGGNAADAAVAAALMLAVVDGHNSGLGGGCFIVARSSRGEVTAIDGRETAPAAATPKMFFRNGEPQPSLSKIGPLASGVPGAVAAYHRLSVEIGTDRWSDAVQAAADVAENGFTISASYAKRLASVAHLLKDYEASRQLFLHANGSPLQPGDELIQRDLAKTLRELDGGPDSFYRGPFAERLDRWMRSNGGLITAADLQSYETFERAPVESQFRSNRVLGFPPPSSGGIHVAQILGMLERFDLADIHADRPSLFFHLIAEAMRRAFADRAKWLGDPAFADVPAGLIDPSYLRRLSSSIRDDRVSAEIEAGTPPAADRAFFPKDPRHTTHLSVADAEGNWVAITSTVNTTFGSKVVIPETGVVMNNQMDDFAIAPGVPNAFGLIGREANAPEPGKRPLSSMSPTLVFRDEKPILSCGAAGGPRIISATAQIVLRVLALKQDVADALAAPRIHHQWRPNVLYVESRLSRGIREDLRDLGHPLKQLAAIGTAQGVQRFSEGELLAASEIRVENTSAGAW